MDGCFWGGGLVAFFMFLLTWRLGKSSIDTLNAIANLLQRPPQGSIGVAAVVYIPEYVITNGGNLAIPRGRLLPALFGRTGLDMDQLKELWLSVKVLVPIFYLINGVVLWLLAFLIR